MLNRRDFIRKSIWAAGMVAGGVALGGCGSVFNKQSASTTAKPTLRIGYIPITDHLTMIIHSQKEFKSLVLEPVKFSSWAEISEALKNNAIDGAFLLTPIGLTLRQKGVAVKAVFAGHRNGSVITMKNLPEFNTVADLKGKTIAIPSRFSTHNILIQKYLSDNGLDPAADVKFIDMAPPEMVNALSVGKIDGFIVAEPFGGQAELQKVGKVLALSKDIWPDHICCVLNMQTAVIEKNPESVEELIGGFVQAASFIDKNPAESAKLSVKYLGQKPEVIEHVLTQPLGRITFNDLIPQAKDLSATQDYMLKYGISKEAVDLKQYIDDRFARKAYGV